jgi:hypothetical protein
VEPLEMDGISRSHQTPRRTMSGTVMEMYVVYKRPKDYPDHYVLRKWIIGAAKDRPLPSEWFALADTLDAIRAQVPNGFIRLERDPNDEPQIVECWI